MTLLAVGVSHQATPVAVRERLAYRPDELGSALETLNSYVHEGVLLSTCNRTEIYAMVGHAHSGRAALLRFLSDSRGIPEQAFEPSSFAHVQEDAAQHLFRVAAGLESMVIGEPQILGQVRSAFDRARTHMQLGPTLSRLFHQALAVGKRARTESDIARSAASVSYAAVELARSTLGELRGRTVLIMGAGKMGQLAVRTLRSKGVHRLLVASRSLASARRLASQLGGEPLKFDALIDALQRADIVISSTAAGGFVLEYQTVHDAMQHRNGRPLLLIDIAVPRDIDPSVATVPGVHLSNIDDLESVCRQNLEVRRQETLKVEPLIGEEVERFAVWRESREVAPVIQALVQRAEGIRQAELERTLARLGSLSDRDRNVVSALSVSLMNKLLHEPIVRLKERGNGHDGRGYVRALSDLFRLAEEPDGPSSRA